MIVYLNGDEREVRDGATVADVIELLEVRADGRGVAVAVDAEVVPRGAWQDHELPDGAQVEVLAAMQGG
jgi:sulfur carrier protein